MEGLVSAEEPSAATPYSERLGAGREPFPPYSKRYARTSRAHAYLSSLYRKHKTDTGKRAVRYSLP